MGEYICSISGCRCEDPLIDITSGYVYDKKSIDAYVDNEMMLSPLTNQKIESKNLIKIKQNLYLTKPRSMTSTSIPGLLSLFQNEWDTTMAETHTLRQHLHDVRNQLSQCLYMQDAATRVISRLIRERDNYKNEVFQLQQTLLVLQKKLQQQSLTEQEPGISSELLQELQNKAKELLSYRKKRVVEGLPDVEYMKKRLECKGGYPLHSSSERGILCIDIHDTHNYSAKKSKADDENATNDGDENKDENKKKKKKKLKEDDDDNDEIKENHQSHYDNESNKKDNKTSDINGSRYVLSGGLDSCLCLFDIDNETSIQRLTGHTKPISDCKIHPTYPLLLSASQDKTVKVWKSSEIGVGEYECMSTMKGHRGEVFEVSIHPILNYYASTSADKTWAFVDIHTNTPLQTAKNLQCQYRCLRFHPDGMIVGGGGSDGNVYIWDMKDFKHRATLESHTDKINGICFSENGYYLATASEDSTVRLWDLRKSLSFQTLDMKDVEHEKKRKNLPKTNNSVTAVNFDSSGQYIACSTKNHNIYLFYFQNRNSAAYVCSLTEHEDQVTDVKFGAYPTLLVSSSMDRTVRVWEA